MSDFQGVPDRATSPPEAPSRACDTCSGCGRQFVRDLGGFTHRELRECEDNRPDDNQCMALVCMDCLKRCTKCENVLCKLHALRVDDEILCLDCKVLTVGLFPELRFIQFDRLELAAAIEALRLYGPVRMGNRELFAALMKKLQGALESV